MTAKTMKVVSGY